MVTNDKLLQALGFIRYATHELVQKGFFVKGVLTRFDYWVKGLPEDKRELAYKIALMAGQQHAGTGADVNGVALDQLCKPSLESLVLHYLIRSNSPLVL